MKNKVEELRELARQTDTFELKARILALADRWERESADQPLAPEQSGKGLEKSPQEKWSGVAFVISCWLCGGSLLMFSNDQSLVKGIAAGILCAAFFLIVLFYRYRGAARFS